MLDADLLAALVAADDRLRAAATEALDRPVPACPGWTGQDLIGHVGQVQRWATRVVLAPPGEKVARRDPDAPTGPAVIGWFAEGADDLVAALSSVDLDHEGYSFVGTRPARWWLRRQAHETVVHAWDLEDAIGVPGPIDPAVATDGIDELFEVFFDPRVFATDGFAAEGETLHVHATDIDGEWMVRVAPGSVEVTREHGKGDLAVRGRAEDLLLVLWNRRPLEAVPVEVFGTAELLDRMIAASPISS